MTDARGRSLRDGQVAAAIREARLVAVLRRVEPRTALLALVDELADAGVRAIEITWDAANAAADLVAVRDRLGGRGDTRIVVGAGTLLRRDQLDAAAAAGADFGVSPTLDLGLVARAVEMDLPYVPGAFTPTEIATAWNAGATFVKVFPASAVGPAFVRELRGPLPEVELVPTGGIDADGAAAFLAAGAVAVGVGGSLVRGTSDERRRIVAAAAGDRW